MKNNKLLLLSALSALFAAFAASSVLCDDEINNPDWMWQNKEKLKNLPLNKVVLLGSHDAASWRVVAHKPNRHFDAGTAKLFLRLAHGGQGRGDMSPEPQVIMTGNREIASGSISGDDGGMHGAQGDGIGNAE